VEEEVRLALAIVLCGVALLALEAVLVSRRAEAAAELAPRGSLAEAEAAVGAFVDSSRALYESDGDLRVAERVPASPELVSEMSADISYARTHLRVVERRDLVRMERIRSGWLPGGLAEVHTREFWIFRRLAPPGGGDARPPRSAVWNVRYELAREAGSWRVLDYRLERDAPPAGSGSR
jgi:hypothetical protein